ncbi:histamine H1 receptor-like [Penaeus japonicus]|uniref:histamine H1 receptor-like n=1 Tax=Penaeus japonicus TaxID=27405 RepID=UPI001C715AF7|nr:histamine H1 receptor-like [Penaeus japonicus]
MDERDVQLLPKGVCRTPTSHRASCRGLRIVDCRGICDKRSGWKKSTIGMVSNLFIMSLAAADLTVGVIVMPISAAYAMMGEWRLGLVVCQFWLSADYTASTASIFNLVILSLDRYWSITAPLRYLRRRTRRRALVMIGASWAAAMAWLLPVLAWHYLATGGERLHPPHVCETEFSNSAAFKAVTAALNFYLPTALMLYLYCRIFREIKMRQALGRVNFSNHDLPTDSCSEAEKGPRLNSRNAGRSPRPHASSSSSSPRRSGLRAAAASASAPPAEGPRSHFQSLTVVSPGCQDCSHFAGVTVSVEYLPDDADPDSPAAVRRGRHHALQQQQEAAAAAAEEEEAFQYQQQLRRQVGGGGRLGPHHNHIHCYQSYSRPHPSWHPAPSAASTWDGRGGRANNARHHYDAAHTSGNPRSSANASNGTRKRATLKGRGSGASAAAGGRRAETVNLAKERKAARQLGVIVGCFMMCWVPYFTLFPIMALCETCVPAHAHTATIWLGYLNSALNPVLYPLCNHNFRRAFARMLRLPSRPRNNHCAQRIATITIRHCDKITFLVGHRNKLSSMYTSQNLKRKAKRFFRGTWRMDCLTLVSGESSAGLSRAKISVASWETKNRVTRGRTRQGTWRRPPPARTAGGRANNARHHYDAAHTSGNPRSSANASNGTRKRATLKGRGSGASAAAGGRRAETVNLAKERKAARQLGVIVGCFMMCWVPYFTLFPIMALCETCVPAHAHTATIWLGYLNSALNPVLYPLCNHNFRRAFARMLRLPSRPRNNHCAQRIATITIRH